MKSILRKLFVITGMMLLCTCMGVWGASPDNSITVRKFVADDNDAAATIEKRTDRATNKPCALIKVTNLNNLTGFRFNVGSNYSHVEEREDDRGRHIVYLWVSPNVKSMTISHESDAIKPVRTDMPRGGLKEATVYNMELGYVALPNPTDRQFVEFNVAPSNAYLEVNGEPWPLDAKGYAAKALPFGTYQYTLTAPDYHTEAGEFVLMDPNNSQKVNVRMRQDYGWVTLIGEDLRDADIFIDMVKYPYVNINRMKMKSGRHTLKIVRKNYSPFTQTFDVADNQEARLSPQLDANYSTVTVNAPDECSIFINGELKGIKTWIGPLEPGTYNLEARKAGHNPFRRQFEVADKNHEYTINLSAPEPIYGSLDIISDPKGAAIWVDGKDIGKTTPYVIPKLLIGTHKIELKKQDYQVYTKSVEIRELEVGKIDAKLTNTVELRLSWSPSDATLKIDGQARAVSSPYTFVCLPRTTHTISLAHDGYKNFSKTVTVNKSQSEYYTMKKIVYHDYSDWGREEGYSWHPYRYFYITADGAFGNLNGVGGTMGFVTHRFNMQFEGGMCFNSGIDVYQYVENKYVTMSAIKPGVYYGGRIGLAFCAGRVMFNPQVGYRHLDCKDTWVGSGLGSLRMQIRTSSHFAFVLSPEYYFALTKGKLFEKAADEFNDVKKFGTGFRIGAGFELYF